MKIMYFTYGDNPQFPYKRNEYVVAIGTDEQDAIDAYVKKHPNPNSSLINCAFVYTFKHWIEKTAMFYKGEEPSEVIISENAFIERDELRIMNDFEIEYYRYKKRKLLTLIATSTSSRVTEDDCDRLDKLFRMRAKGLITVDAYMKEIAEV